MGPRGVRAQRCDAPCPLFRKADGPDGGLAGLQQKHKAGEGLAWSGGCCGLLVGVGLGRSRHSWS